MRLWRWWTLENSTQSATLLARLATTLGILVVARFFLDTPQLSYIVTNTYRVDREVLAEGFSATGQQVPDYAVEIADFFDARYEHEILSIYSGTFDSNNVGIAELLGNTGDQRFLIPETYSSGITAFPEGFGFIALSFSLDHLYESFYVAALALAADADESEIARVAAALTDAIVSRVSVTLSNLTRVKATDVSINTPDDLEIVQDLPADASLSADEEYEIIYEGDPGSVLQKQRSDFLVKWDEAGILNIGLLTAIGIFMLVFWFFTTAKAMVQDPLDG